MSTSSAYIVKRNDKVGRSVNIESIILYNRNIESFWKRFGTKISCGFPIENTSSPFTIFS